MEGAISTALERNLFAWSPFQEGRWTELFHVCHVLLTDCLCFCRVVFHKCMLKDSAFLRQFSYVITNTGQLTYGITVKVYTGTNRTIFNLPDRFQPFHTMENCWWCVIHISLKCWQYNNPPLCLYQFQIIYHILCHTIQQLTWNMGHQQYTHPLLNEHIQVIHKTSNI